MSRGFIRVFIAALCGGELPSLALQLRPFALHPYLPSANVHNLRQNKRSLKHLPPWQKKAFARTKGRR